MESHGIEPRDVLAFWFGDGTNERYSSAWFTALLANEERAMGDVHEDAGGGGARKKRRQVMLRGMWINNSVVR